MNELTQAPLHHHHPSLEQCQLPNEHHSVLSSSSISDKNNALNCPVIVSLPTTGSSSSTPGLVNHNYFNSGGSGVIPTLVKSESVLSQHQQVIQQHQQESMSSTSMGDEDTDDLIGISGAGGNDAEGVWSADIEQAFQEALAIYPPCGRRKIILSEEGKMYGRNELIARYIKLRTGKTRTRKQVSSHIQVLARRRAKEVTPSGAGGGGGFLSNSHPILSSGAGPLEEGISFSTPLQQQQQHSRKDGSATPPKLTKYSLKPEVMSASCLADEMKPSNVNNSSGYLSIFPSTSAATMPSSVWQAGPAVQQQSSSVAKYSPWLTNDVNYMSEINTNSGPTGPPTLHTTVGGTVDGAIPANVPSGNLLHAMSCAKLQLLHLAAYISHNSYALNDQMCFYLPPEQYESNAGHPSWHLFVRVYFGNSSFHSTTPDTKPADANRSLLHSLEPLDITQISDKFPDRNGLKDLFEKGPQNAFFLMKIWGDVNTSIGEEAYFGTSLAMQSMENLPVRLNTKICSFGKQVVEKIEDGLPTLENCRYIYRFNKSEMCDYMKSFITKLLQLKSSKMMNSVLENFTILQVASHMHTKETLLCLAYVFEVSQSSYGSQHKLYRLAGPTSVSNAVF